MRSLNGLALIAAALMSVSAYAQHGHPGHMSHAHAGHGAAGSQAFGDADDAVPPEGITVDSCWIRALPNRLPAAAYFQITNTGANPAVLVGAQADGFRKVMLHTNETSGGMARMLHVDKVAIPAGGQLEFAPGGHHVMLEQPDSDLEIGGERMLKLWFEGNHAVTVQCDVRPPGTIK